MDYKKLSEIAARLLHKDIWPYYQRPMDGPDGPPPIDNDDYREGYNRGVVDLVRALMNPEPRRIGGQLVIKTEEDKVERYWSLDGCRELTKKEVLA